jgi:hypothetical protein
VQEHFARRGASCSLVQAKRCNLKLEELATTSSATSSDQSSFTSHFFNSLFARLTHWFADTTNGIKSFFAERVQTNELCVDDVCVTRDQFAEVFGGSQGAAAAGAPSSGVPPEAPAASPVPEGTDADAGTTTASNVAEPQPTSETPADVADQEPDAVVEEQEPGDEPAPAPPAELDAANDNQPAEELLATGTE